MIEYILKRIGQTLFVLFIVSIFAFALIRLAPGTPALLMVPDGSTDEVIAAMEEKLGLNDPLYIQYINYMKGIFHGDLGTSTMYRVPVSDIVSQRLPNTAILACISVIVGLCLAIPLGIFAGSRRGTGADFFAMFFALLGQSLSPGLAVCFTDDDFCVLAGRFAGNGNGKLDKPDYACCNACLPDGSTDYPCRSFRYD